MPLFLSLSIYIYYIYIHLPPGKTGLDFLGARTGRNILIS